MLTAKDYPALTAKDVRKNLLFFELVDMFKPKVGCETLCRWFDVIFRLFEIGDANASNWIHWGRRFDFVDLIASNCISQFEWLGSNTTSHGCKSNGSVNIILVAQQG